jgi:Tol biopolymer transport system component
MRRSRIALLPAIALALTAGGAADAATSAGGVLYTHTVQGRVAVWELAASGGNGRELLAAAAQPAWSPDGSRFAFARQLAADQSRGADIATADADGSDVHVLTDGGRDGSPAWSPDGTQIAFTRSSDLPSARPLAAIWTVASGGGGPRQLTHPASGSTDSAPAWSPGGAVVAFTRVTFARPPARSDIAIWTVDVTSGAETRLTSPGTDGALAAWSPDGARIAFISGRDRDGRTYGEDETPPNGEVYTMRADGSDPRRITHTRGPEGSVTWSASGSRLLYSSAPASAGFGPYELVLARDDGSCATPLTHGRAWHTEPTAPASGVLDSLPLDCTAPATTRPTFIAGAPGLAGRRVHGGRRAESALARQLLASLGAETAIRSVEISAPPASRHAAPGSTWLRLAVTGTATRNAAAAVRPTWEATLLADRYAALAARRGARPLLGVTIRYLGSGQTVSTTEAARHEFVGSELSDELLPASEIVRSLRATRLPEGVQLASVRVARMPGGNAPEIVLRIAAKSAAGRLFTLSSLLLDPLQLDQGAYVELRGRCGALIGALGAGDLGTRQQVGTMRQDGC